MEHVKTIIQAGTHVSFPYSKSKMLFVATVDDSTTSGVQVTAVPKIVSLTDTFKILTINE